MAPQLIQRLVPSCWTFELLPIGMCSIKAFLWLLQVLHVQHVMGSQPMHFTGCSCCLGDCATWFLDDFFTQASRVEMKIIHTVLGRYELQAENVASAGGGGVGCSSKGSHLLGNLIFQKGFPHGQNSQHRNFCKGL